MLIKHLLVPDLSEYLRGVAENCIYVSNSRVFRRNRQQALHLQSSRLNIIGPHVSRNVVAVRRGVYSDYGNARLCSKIYTRSALHLVHRVEDNGIYSLRYKVFNLSLLFCRIVIGEDHFEAYIGSMIFLVFVHSAGYIPYESTLISLHACRNNKLFCLL
jgi:hypothetical protein